MLETLNSKDKKVTEQIRDELLQLSTQEVDYFGRLVEDLLFLAQVSEPTYRGSLDRINIVDLLKDEASAVKMIFDQKSRNIDVDEHIVLSEVVILGDQTLLRRLLRNALENGFSYAKSRVTVHLIMESVALLKIVIKDDGPGLSDQQLVQFGEKKFSRYVEKSITNRVSIGLGSVIMKTICELYKGQLTASNAYDEAGRILGAEIQIRIPVKSGM